MLRKTFAIGQPAVRFVYVILPISLSLHLQHGPGPQLKKHWIYIMLRKTFAILFVLSFIAAQLERTDAQTTLSIEEDITIGSFDLSVPPFAFGVGFPAARDLTFDESTGVITVGSPNEMETFRGGITFDRAGNSTVFFDPFPDSPSFETNFGATFRGPATLGANQFTSGISIDHSTFFGSFFNSHTLQVRDTATGNLLLDLSGRTNDAFGDPDDPEYVSARYNRVRGSLFLQEVGGTVREVLPSSGSIFQFDELNDLGISLGEFEINQRDGNLYDISNTDVDIYDPNDGSLLESIDISGFGLDTLEAHAIDSDRGSLWLLGTTTDPGTIFPTTRLLRVGTIAIPEPSHLAIAPLLLLLSARRRRN